MELWPDSSGTMPPGLCALQQHPYYGAALAALGVNVTCLKALKHGVRVAHLQLLERRWGPMRITWMPRGPVWASGAKHHDCRQVLDLLHQNQSFGTGSLAALDNASEIPAFKAAGYLAVWTAQHVAELDLRPPPQNRRAAQSVKWRNRLRHAERGDLAITHRRFEPGRDDWLLRVEELQRRHRKYHALPSAFTTSWARLHPNATRLFLAHKKGHRIAAMLFLRHPPTATYHIGWSNDEGRAQSAHNLLLWRASNWLAAQGCQRLDLGAIDTQNAPGLARFKLGTGACLRPLGPTMLRLAGLGSRPRAA